MLVGKLEDGKIVQVLKFAREVKFSQEKGWILIDTEIGPPRPTHLLNLKWIPAATRFTWVKDFTFRSTSGS